MYKNQDKSTSNWAAYFDYVGMYAYQYTDITDIKLRSVDGHANGTVQENLQQ